MCACVCIYEDRYLLLEKYFVYTFEVLFEVLSGGS